MTAPIMKAVAARRLLGLLKVDYVTDSLSVIDDKRVRDLLASAAERLRQIADDAADAAQIDCGKTPQAIGSVGACVNSPPREGA